MNTIGRAGLLILSSIIVIGCGSSSDAAPDEEKKAAASTFRGTLGDKTYEVAVSCSYFGTDSFTMRSDKTDMTDTNGDGLIISGDEFNGGFSLTIIDNGKTYSIGRLANFSKGENTAEGSGQLIEEETSAMKEVKFKITCD